jgi:hypothetical protein
VGVPASLRRALTEQVTLDGGGRGAGVLFATIIAEFRIMPRQRNDCLILPAMLRFIRSRFRLRSELFDFLGQQFACLRPLEHRAEESPVGDLECGRILFTLHLECNSGAMQEGMNNGQAFDA